jgi:hypothetical protein
MADEAAVASVDTAVAAWDASAPTTETAPVTTETQLDAVQAEPTPLDGLEVAEEQVVDPLEALKDNPRVQELVQAETQLKEYQTALADLPYQVPDPQSLKMQLTDAHMLYDVVTGKQSPMALLQTMLSNPEWTADQKRRVVSELAQGIAQITGTPIAAAAAGKQVDPAMQEVERLRTQIAQEKSERENQAFVQRAADARTKVGAHIAEWVKDKAPAEFADSYAKALATHFPPDKVKDVIAQVEKGDYAAINKAVIQIHNAKVKELKAFSDWAIKNKQAVNKIAPKQMAGGAPSGTPEKTESLVGYENTQKRHDAMIASLRGQ